MACILLKNNNKHPRDENIEFQDEGHVYYINKKKGFHSVTTIVHKAFRKFNSDKIIDNMMKSKNWKDSKYYGMTKNQIKLLWKKNGNEAANLGTIMHYLFEYHYNDMYKSSLEIHPKEFQKFMNSKSYKETIEYKYFINFINDHTDLTPYRTEWSVYDEDKKIVGSIDMVAMNEDGTVSIYDWKRCKNIEKDNCYNKYSIVDGLFHIMDTNYWHYTLQLNLYKYILESKYDVIVKDLHLIVIHPENETNNYEKIKLPSVSKQELDILISNTV